MFHQRSPAGTLWPLLLAQLLLAAPHLPAAPQTAVANLLSVQGQVDYDRAAQTNWVSASAGQPLLVYDRIRTGERSRAALQWLDRSVLRISPGSLLDILPPRQSSARSRIWTRLGLFYFLHRNRPREIELETPLVRAAIKGTEFHLAVEPNGRTVLTMIDGLVGLTNAFGGIGLSNGEQAIVDPGQPPRKTALIETVNIIQWCLYYPAVLDLEELGLSELETTQLTDSLLAYRRGNLLQALDGYLQARALQPVAQLSAAERTYQAGLWLAAGAVTNAEALLGLPSTHSAGDDALRWLIAAVKLEKDPGLPPPVNASQLLGHSWYLQSRYELEAAREDARRAVAISPRFAFGWARVAELEYSLGRLGPAADALAKTLELAPDHAQAHALLGFVLLGQDRVKEALVSFDKAIELDSALANGWLGRGLCRMQQGRTTEGRADLQTAAALEPNRWVLRSYLAKAYLQEAEDGRSRPSNLDLVALAEEELGLARAQDPEDPTPWLYSALLNYQRNRTTAAIINLEKAVALNDNQRVYRSRLLLDRDLAVRSADLANIYESANMTELSLRESTRSVTYEYSNFSAHRNLASSFNALRDPARFNLRYETDWFHEVLLANLLAPPGGILLSQNLPQQEYFRPFTRNRLGLSTTTEIFSDSEWRQLATHFGAIGGTSYALDLQYQNKDGIRPNNDLSRLEWYSQVKQKISNNDSLLLITKYQDYDAGDNFQYYDPSQARPDFRFQEKQTPLLLLGHHHEWSPGVHTLFLGGRLINEQRFRDTGVNQLIFSRDSTSLVATNVETLGLDPMGNDIGGLEVDYQGKFEIYTAELNQIIQQKTFTHVFGGRYQQGNFETRNRLDIDQFGNSLNFSFLTNFFASPPAASRFDEPFQRLSLYTYHTWEVIDDLLLTAGVSYDSIRYPTNFRQPPVGAGVSSHEQVSPKAALFWAPRKEITLRAGYFQSVGGVSFDESTRLEPTQLAGFRQSFRTAIPESVVGSVAAPTYEGFGLALDFQTPTYTYLSVQAELLRSNVDRVLGAFGTTNRSSPQFQALPDMTRETLDFEQRSFKVTLDQILGHGWFFSAAYRFSQSDLEQRLPGLQPLGGSSPVNRTRADLHELRMAATFKHPSGFFTRTEGWWTRQQNRGYEGGLPGDDFWQLNCYLGYEFPWKQGEVTIGVLNATDQNYHLNPLNTYAELPRERLFYARVRLNF